MIDREVTFSSGEAIDPNARPIERATVRRRRSRRRDNVTRSRFRSIEAGGRVVL
jgi:hypothetical protein